MRMRELWVIVDMFYVLIRMVVAQAYPFIKITRTPKISSVQSLNCVRLFATPWTTAHQASLSNTFSQSLPKLMSIKSVMPSSHLLLCHPLLLLPSIFPSIRVFSSESAGTLLRVSQMGAAHHKAESPKTWLDLWGPQLKKVGN